MIRVAGRCIAALLFPGGVVFLASVGFLRPNGLPLWLQQPVSALPYIVFAFGLIFGWYLASARMVLSILLLALVDRGLLAFSAGGTESASIGQTMFSVTAFLLPLNLLAFSILKEDAVSTVRGALRVLVVLAQPFLVLWLCYPEQQELAAAFQARYLPWPTSDWTPLPQAALLAFAIAMGMHLARFTLYRDPLEGGAIWALAAIFLAYHCGQFGWRPTNFFSAAGLILFLTLVQSSHQRTYRDELTGIAGRLAYEEAIGRLGKQFSVAVLAVDQLKSYAGAHGKSVSEQILKLVAPKIQADCQSGRVFRVSGEEFTVLFPGRSATETLVALEAARKGIESTSLFLRGRDRVWEDVRGTKGPGAKDRELTVTLSIGVAEKVNEAATLSLVVKFAYRALYEAKEAGGNVVKRGLVAPDPPRRSYGNSGRIVASGEY